MWVWWYGGVGWWRVGLRGSDGWVRGAPAAPSSRHVGCVSPKGEPTAVVRLGLRGFSDFGGWQRLTPESHPSGSSVAGGDPIPPKSTFREGSRFGQLNRNAALHPRLRVAAVFVWPQAATLFSGVPEGHARETFSYRGGQGTPNGREATTCRLC